MGPRRVAPQGSMGRRFIGENRASIQQDRRRSSLRPCRRGATEGTEGPVRPAPRSRRSCTGRAHASVRRTLPFCGPDAISVASQLSLMGGIGPAAPLSYALRMCSSGLLLVWAEIDSDGEDFHILGVCGRGCVDSSDGSWLEQRFGCSGLAGRSSSSGGSSCGSGPSSGAISSALGSGSRAISLNQRRRT
jgi:hypothetical protein